MTIAVLPARVAAQIAAGEVVERPASVVKELVENAIDAGATQVNVSIEQGGTKSIRVQDNGSGIPADQVATAFSRHATSKLRTADDLRNIATLGFRGEALPSIAAVSVLTCVTCTADAQAATQYRIRYGEPEFPPRPTGAAVGTSITVADLFGNQPAKLKLEQHAAHERVLFDRTFGRRTSRPADSQNLMLPERATLDAFQH